MEQELEMILDLCIEQIRRGRSLEACLAAYPAQAEKLKPLLELAQKIENLPLPAAFPETMSAALINLGTQTSAGRKKPGLAISSIFQQPRLSWVFAVSSFLLVVLFGAATISANSMPGDILYPVKLATEKVKFILTWGPEKKAELRLTFSDERLRELTKVFQQSGTVDTGLLRAMLYEAKLALENADELPEQHASFFQLKFNHLNAYQTESLEQIQPRVPPSEREAVDRAIEVCGNRMQWMMRRMREGKHVPWGRGCDMMW